MVRQAAAGEALVGTLEALSWRPGGLASVATEGRAQNPRHEPVEHAQAVAQRRAVAQAPE